MEPFLFINPAITPEYTSLLQLTSTSISGSSTCGPAPCIAFINEYFVAAAKAFEEESTTCVAPSSRTYLTPITG